MLSRNIVFTGKDQVEFMKEAVRGPGSGEVMLKARKTLISTGTEGICLSRLFEPGSHWDHWVTYPFHPGYLMVAEVVAIGVAITAGPGAPVMAVVSGKNETRPWISSVIGECP